MLTVAFKAHFIFVNSAKSHYHCYVNSMRHRFVTVSEEIVTHVDGVFLKMITQSIVYFN